MTRDVVLFACAVASGPTALALTPPLVAHRVARDNRIAAQRFAALKKAVQQTAAEAGGPADVCDGRLLQEHYSGPPFTEKDWHRITANYVKQDGYFFMVYCHQNGGYAIEARPFGEQGYGTRRFCTGNGCYLR